MHARVRDHVARLRFSASTLAGGFLLRLSLVIPSSCASEYALLLLAISVPYKNLGFVFAGCSEGTLHPRTKNDTRTTSLLLLLLLYNYNMPLHGQ